MARKLSELYATDLESRENGRWVELRPATKTDKALRIKVRSTHSKTVRREEQKLDKKYRMQYIAGDGQLDPDSQDEREVLLVSRAVLIGWENFPNDDGTGELVFTPQVVQDTLRQFPQLRREIIMLARMDETFRPAEIVAAEREGIAGN